MKTFSTKVALAALAVAALATGPAFAKSHRVLQDNASGVYVAAPRTVYAAPGNDIPGYASDGTTVGIANPDWYGAQSQR
ncbi:MAG TPA: hypothetical protein VHU22_01700 [Xanthobacteraceae bacterium]|jgi:hypothetical protein|nr:hypothetical protein [Xanthobacteraceae bacterium]